MRGSTNVFSPLYPEWINIEEAHLDSGFYKIIQFFVIESLCEGQSWSGKTLQGSYLWKSNPWQPEAYLKKKITDAIWHDNRIRLYMAETRSDLEARLFGNDLGDDFYYNLNEQRAGFVKVGNSKKCGNQVMSLFYHIRNGFAHGRFGVFPLNNDEAYILEDGEKKDKQFEVTARVIVYKSSLLRIIETIQNGPDNDPDYLYEIAESMKRGNNTKKAIINDLGISELIWERASSKLKYNGIIMYKKNRWVLL